MRVCAPDPAGLVLSKDKARQPSPVPSDASSELTELTSTGLASPAAARVNLNGSTDLPQMATTPLKKRKLTFAEREVEKLQRTPGNVWQVNRLSRQPGANKTVTDDCEHHGCRLRFLAQSTIRAMELERAEAMMTSARRSGKQCVYRLFAPSCGPTARSDVGSRDSVGPLAALRCMLFRDLLSGI